MTEQNKTTSDLESRGSPGTSRKRTLGRRIYNAVGLVLLEFFVRILWRTYRIERVIGADIAEQVQRGNNPYAPCFWHQHLVLTGMMLYRWHRENGFVPYLVVSASVDGDAPSKLVEDFGGQVIRGSSNHGGGKVLRDMRKVFRQGYCVFTTADGPTGPNREFKQGVALMARVANVPMVPFAFAVDRAWYLSRWDSFMIPKPFARVVIAFGEPVSIPKGTSVRDLEPWRLKMENAVNELVKRSNDVIEQKSE